MRRLKGLSYMKIVILNSFFDFFFNVFGFLIDVYICRVIKRVYRNFYFFDCGRYIICNVNVFEF